MSRTGPVPATAACRTIARSLDGEAEGAEPAAGTLEVEGATGEAPGAPEADAAPARAARAIRRRLMPLRNLGLAGFAERGSDATSLPRPA